MRAAVIGCGPWGQAHMREYVSNPNTTLVAVCGRTPSKTRTIAERFGVRHYLSVPELVASEDLDLASVATGELDHFEATVALIEAGVPTLVEKPLTFQLGEARQLVSLARDRSVNCGVNFNMRYLMPFQLLRKALDAGAIGRPISYMWKFAHRWPPPDIDQDIAVVITHHIHGLNLLLSLAGPIQSVAAMAVAGQDPSRRTTVGAVMTFDSGAMGVLYGGVDGALSNDIMALECQGTLGRATVKDATAEFTLSTLGPELDQVYRPFFADVDEGNFQKSLQWHLAEFVEAVRDGVAAPIPIEEGYEALRVAWAIIESAQIGESVRVDDIAPSLSTRLELYGAPKRFREPAAGANATGYSSKISTS